MEPESTYSTLQSWYLARLRTEAAELSERSRLTPMARIDNDRIALIQHGGKAATPVKPAEQHPLEQGVALVVWLLLNIGMFWFLFNKSQLPDALLVVGASMISSAALVTLLRTRLGKLESHRASLEQRVAESTLREQIIADYAKDFVFAFDESLRVACCNMASMRLLGYLPDSLAGKNLSDILVANNLSDVKQRVEKSKDGKTFEFEITAVSKFGTLIDLGVTAEWSHRVQLFFASARDVTAEKAVQRARGEFVSMISHDVRAPLQGVLFAIDTLANPLGAAVDEKAAKSLTRMERNVQTVIDLIGELIDFERSADTALVLKKTAIDIHVLVDEIFEQVRDVATYKSIRLNNQTAPITVNADRARIARVVLNLIANALKFSPNGSEIVVASKDQGSAVEIGVSDQGAGIPKQLQAAIFERYFQIDSQNAAAEDGSQSIPGSGLGLAICKAFVEAHDGLIGVESAKDSSGSTFWFTLPK